MNFWFSEIPKFSATMFKQSTFLLQPFLYNDSIKLIFSILCICLMARYLIHWKNIQKMFTHMPIFMQIFNLTHPWKILFSVSCTSNRAKSYFQVSIPKLTWKKYPNSVYNGNSLFIFCFYWLLINHSKPSKMKLVIFYFWIYYSSFYVGSSFSIIFWELYYF